VFSLPHCTDACASKSNSALHRVRFAGRQRIFVCQPQVHRVPGTSASPALPYRNINVVHASMSHPGRGAQISRADRPDYAFEPAHFVRHFKEEGVTSWQFEPRLFRMYLWRLTKLGFSGGDAVAISPVGILPRNVLGAPQC